MLNAALIESSEEIGLVVTSVSIGIKLAKSPYRCTPYVKVVALFVNTFKVSYCRDSVRIICRCSVAVKVAEFEFNVYCPFETTHLYLFPFIDTVVAGVV